MNQEWISGSPIDLNIDLEKWEKYRGGCPCFLLEFPEGDRFVVARLTMHDDGDSKYPCLMSLSDGGIISDRPNQFLPIADPGNDKRMH